MKLRVRAAGILVNDKDQILLVMDKLDSGDGFWWGPPGGGMEEDDESIEHCLKREIFEETGLKVDVGRLIYVREYRQTGINTHHIEFFFEVFNAQGRMHDLSADKPPIGADPRRFAQWMSCDDLQNITVFPAELKNGFWLKGETRVAPATYLGVETDW
jgi:ADP-ribose pyrophosphatase YjhB (NUDIX family)